MYILNSVTVVICDLFMQYTYIICIIYDIIYIWVEWPSG